MCGASSEEKSISAQQTALFKDLSAQASTIFGDSSKVFNDLVSSLSPIVKAGINQEGFSATELANLKSGAITQTGQAYKNASSAIKQDQASFGGGNISLPGGADIGRNIEVANSAAGQTASELNEITQADYATGRSNYLAATGALENAPNVFNSATSAGGLAVNAGSAAEDTANKINQENGAWVGAVTGALGGVVGNIATGGLQALGSNIFPGSKIQ